MKSSDWRYLLPGTYFVYLTDLIEIFSIFVIRYGKSKKEERSKGQTGYSDNE